MSVHSKNTQQIGHTNTRNIANMIKVIYNDPMMNINAGEKNKSCHTMTRHRQGYLFLPFLFNMTTGKRKREKASKIANKK